MQKIPVRKLFWEALEMALETKTHQLAKDIAAALGENDTPLLKALREEKVSAYLFDEPADQDVDDIGEYRCDYMVSTGAFMKPCRSPVVWKGGGGTRCLQHSLCEANPVVQLPIFRPVAGHDILLSADSQSLYTEDGALCGQMSENGQKAFVFEVE